MITSRWRCRAIGSHWHLLQPIQWSFSQSQRCPFFSGWGGRRKHCGQLKETEGDLINIQERSMVLCHSEVCFKAMGEDREVMVTRWGKEGWSWWNAVGGSGIRLILPNTFLGACGHGKDSSNVSFFCIDCVTVRLKPWLASRLELGQPGSKHWCLTFLWSTQNH